MMTSELPAVDMGLVVLLTLWGLGIMALVVALTVTKVQPAWPLTPPAHRFSHLAGHTRALPPRAPVLHLLPARATVRRSRPLGTRPGRASLAHTATCRPRHLRLVDLSTRSY